MIQTNIQIISGSLKIHGVLTKASNTHNLGVLFLHGGGNSNSERYLQLQEKMATAGIDSVAFDFRGCGLSEGNFNNSSLDDRLIDADSALKVFIEKTNLPESRIYVWGSSMGGHIATRLLDRHPNLAGIILQSAAAYGIEVEKARFGPDFTDTISKIGSAEDSLAFPSLEKFVGRKFVIYGEYDEIIPKAIQLKYQSLTPKENYFMLKGGIHSMLRPQNANQQRTLDQMLNLAIKFILAK